VNEVSVQAQATGKDPTIIGDDAFATVAAMHAGKLSAADYAGNCLARVRELEDRVGAFAFVDDEYVMSQARATDAARAAGMACGPLHGLPVAVKDIFDTADMPTENGTILHAGRRPDHDATAVARLRAAGAVIIGKTVTAEMAVYAPGKTKNPHDLSRTPGGSSMGSAAAVAAGMAPLAIGTQTNGSTIRPASYCGVVGFKPTFGLISRHGALPISSSLDQVGVFSRSVRDAALIAESLIGFDEHDTDTRPQARPALLQTVQQEPPVTPRLAFVKSPVWSEADRDTHDAFSELVEHLGDRCTEIELSRRFEHVVAWHKVVMESELSWNFAREYERGAAQLSAVLREMIERGRTYMATDYIHALNQRSGLTESLDAAFDEFDAIITPAATGEAPQDLSVTGSPVFCTLWTFLGLPSITLPLLQGSHGMPMGVQLVGAFGDDARLLRTAQWLVEHLESN